jgi:hypothetical protein
MNRNALHPSAMWLNGTIVALAIREGLTQVIPHLTSAAHDFNWATGLQITRALLFLITIVRFYLGSILYFDAVHINEKTSSRYVHKSYGLDFMVGLTHFALFFAWATTISDVGHREKYTALSHFEAVGAVIILYDLVWLFVNWRYDTKQAILPWTCINVVTILICCAVIWVPYGMDSVFTEQFSIAVVSFIGLIDIAGTLRNRNFIADWISDAFPSDGKHLSAVAGEE